VVALSHVIVTGIIAPTFANVNMAFVWLVLLLAAAKIPLEE
jgi:hypothetical protein